MVHPDDTIDEKEIEEFKEDLAINSAKHQRRHRLVSMVGED
jgi:hypothetical protein